MSAQAARIDVRRLGSRLPPVPRTRFAPSPTGHLHLGHVANAIYVWGIARALGGRVIVRIEDHDRGRCRPEYERAMMDDLSWLGLVGDEPPATALRDRPSPYRQSDSEGAFKDALARLRASAHVYACRCSRQDIAAGAAASRHRETPYPGRCRHRGLPDAPGRGLRVELPDCTESFDDGRLGRQVHRPAAQCGDPLVRDRHGCWTYQFAVTVDDLRHHVHLVIRGEDLLDSTGRQLTLRRLLGGSGSLLFLHHGLVRKENGDKLSKANRDIGIRDRRMTGSTPAEVLGEAAFLVGLTQSRRAVTVEELPGLIAC